MKTAVISPSGKFYGSEQTLFEFLARTESYDVYIKYEINGLYDKLIASTFKHKYFKYNSLSSFYLFFSLKLIYKYDKVYVNEGGHSKYIILLAKLFFWKTFYIHVRLTEDTQPQRWNKLRSNIHLISTSKYIAELLMCNISRSSRIISSPARAFKDDFTWDFQYNDLEIKKIGVIGRLTTSKGVCDMLSFFNYLEKHNKENYEFYFFGDVDHEDENVKFLLQRIKGFNSVKIVFKGFVSNKVAIYSNLDVVIHFNRTEPLGVIFLESINQGVPFIGFNSGGIGVIAEHLNLNMISISDNWCEEFINAIDNLDIHNYRKAREIMLELYSPEMYCKNIQQLIN